MHQLGAFRGDERRGDQKQRRVPLELAHVGGECVAQRRADGDRAHEVRQRRAGDEELERAGACEQPGHREHEREEDDDGDVLHDRDGEDGAGDRAPRLDLVRADEPEPCRPDREARQQVAREAWEARPPRDLAAQLRREEQESEREGGARLERAARGETMKKGHHEGQRERAREPTHRRKVIAARRFDNAEERRYLPDVTAHNWIEDVRFGDDGLVPVVAQSALAGEVLMVAYADRAALERTRDTGEAHYHSRSRSGLWKKGETSGHTQAVAEVRVDCDGDAVLYVVRQSGPAWRTGPPTCFGEPSGGTLVRLAGTIARRARERPEGSYTARPLGG